MLSMPFLCFNKAFCLHKLLQHMSNCARYGCLNFHHYTVGINVMKLSSLPVIQLPIVDVSTDPLDLLVAGLALRMKQLARTSPKFIELVHDREFRIQIGTDLGLARQIIVNRGKIDTVAGP
jgi:hypothetical protein